MRYTLYTNCGYFIPKRFLANKQQKLVALDGACEILQANNITPDIILGDFDSIKDPEYWGIQLQKPTATSGAR